MQEQTIEGFRVSPQQEIILAAKNAHGFLSQGLVSIVGSLDAARLKSSLEQLIERQEILRTEFQSLSGMVIPLQLPRQGTELMVRESSLASSANQERDLLDLMRNDLREPFDLERAPLIRFHIIELGPKNHMLQFTLPALCGDSRSVDTIAAQIAHLFHGLATAEGRSEDTGKDEPLQYIQYSDWRNSIVEEAEAADGFAFWEKQGNWRGPPVRLPFEKSLAGREVMFLPNSANRRLDAEAAQRISRLCRENQGSPPAFFQGCWFLYLARLAGVSSLALHTCFDGRDFEELAHAVGIFSQNIPLVREVDDHLLFSSFLESLETARDEADTWKDFFVLEQTEFKKADLSLGYEYELQPPPLQGESPGFSLHAKYSVVREFRLKLSLIQEPNAFQCRLYYDAELFDKEVAERFASGYLTLCLAVAARPNRPLREYPILGEQERVLLLQHWSRPEGPVMVIPELDGLHRMLENQAESVPGRIALVYENQHLSYAELDVLANRLAHFLAARGVTQDTIIPLLMNRSLALVIGMFGILKAGAAYLPLEARLPQRRIHAILDEVQAPFILMQKSLRGLLDSKSHRGHELDADPDWRDFPSTNPGRPCSRQNLAYVIYTSGSTGSPKGVMVQHGSTLNLAQALRQVIYEDQPGPLRISLNANLSVDASLKQVVQLGYGQTLVLIPEEIRIDAGALFDYLQSHEMDVFESTPTQWNLMLEIARSGERAAFPRWLLIGGEKIEDPLWQRLAGASKTRAYNVYGPTECTGDTTSARISPHLGRPTIGRPLPNVEIFLLDNLARPVPAGVAGEIHVGGAGLARGYFADPAKTAEKFIPNPLGAHTGSRLYRTGDRAAFLAGGHPEFFGRLDHQVKLRGFRVELGEIEAVLERHPGILESAAVVREDSSGEPRIVAYAVPRKKHQLEVEGEHRYPLPNGLAVFQQNRHETDYLYQEIFERKVYAKFGIHLGENPVVFDVGANIGMFSLFILCHCRSPRIYAFEPIPPIFQTLKRNLQIYEGDVRIFPFGLAEAEKTLPFTFYPGYTMMSSALQYARPEEEVQVIRRALENEANKGSREAAILLENASDLLASRFLRQTHQCRLRRLSDIIGEERIQRIDLLKIDVQRAEMDVIRGLSGKHWELVDQVVMEVHAAPGQENEHRVEELTRVLEEQGFEVFSEQDVMLRGTDRFDLYARRAGLESREASFSRWQPAAELIDRARPVSAAALREYTGEYLPPHMVPAQFVFLDTFPLTSGAKIDRKNLPEPQAQTRPPKPPATPHEELLVPIWSDILGGIPIGTDDNFFHKGGHSLSATRLISRIRKILDVELPLRLLFDAPTIEAFAPHVQRSMETHKGGQAPAILPAPEGEDHPLSFAQQRLWFLDRLDQGAPLYNSPFAARCGGDLDVACLERALFRISQRHQVLRTRFDLRGDEPAQIIDPPRACQIEVIDLISLPRKIRVSAVATLRSQEAHNPFRLDKDHPSRMKLLRMDPLDHLILFTMHHIASDEWSMTILGRELAILYNAGIQGAAPDLPPLPVQYVDFAHWQRQRLTGEVSRKQLAYWRVQLEGAPELLALPKDYSLPRRRSRRGGAVSFDLPPDLSKALRILGQERGATLFMTVLAVFKVLLLRYSGQTDLSVGTPIAGRNHHEIENLIGFFLNMLVIRTRLTGNPNFHEALAGVRESSLGAYANQDLPFAKLVEELQPRRNINTTPLFQAFFFTVEPQDHQKATQSHLEDRQMPLQNLEISAGGEGRLDFLARFELELCIINRGASIGGTLRYDRELFNPVTIESMAGHFQRLLEEVVTQPDIGIENLAMLDEEERQNLLHNWNQTSRNFAFNEPAQHLFESTVRARPDSIALQMGANQLTYAMLNARANRLSGHLSRYHSAPEATFVIFLERSRSLVVSLLAVLKAGGCFVPIDPAFPDERIALILEAARPRAVLTRTALCSRLPENGRARVLTDEKHRYEPFPETDPPHKTWPRSRAYTIFTSGSTGRPKGVQACHGGLTNFLNSMRFSPGFGTDDILLALTTISFDISIAELLLPLIVGGRLVVVDKHTAASPKLLSNALGQTRTTVVQATPATWRMLFNAGWKGDPRLVIWSGGDVLPLDVARKLLADCRSVWNFYGPTETTIWSTVHPLPNQATQDGLPSSVPIGKAVANTRIYLLDRYLQLAPAGVPAQLFIGGEGMARGYLLQPATTAEKFLPDPFARKIGSRLFQTGDLARLLPGGDVEFLGRIDFQVKIRGFRIELGEIETTLLQHPNVQQCVVVARERSPHDKRLIAYIVPENGAGSRSLLREHLEKSLPDYMMPHFLIFLQRMPLTANRKIDRRHLPAPELSQARAGDAFIEPATPLEWRIRMLFEEVTGTRPISSDDDFFEVGGHSLLAVLLISRLGRLTGRDIELSAIFRYRTIAKLAAFLKEQVGVATPPSRMIPIQSRGKLPPMFWFPPQGGGAFCYIELARELGAQLPLYAFQSKGIEGEAEPLTNMADITREYINELIQFYPEGSIRLGGWSMGGVFAFAAACRLRELRRHVELLCLVDTNIRLVPPKEGLDESVLLEIYLAGLSLPFEFESMIGNLNQNRTPRDVLHEVLEKGREYSETAIEVSLDQFEENYKVSRANKLATYRYHPQSLDEQIVLLHTRQFKPERKAEWKQLTRVGLKTVLIPGEHGMLMREPFVGEVARKLKPFLGLVGKDEIREV